MKNIIFLSFAFVLFCGSVNIVNGQNSNNRFNVPRNYSFETEEDFRRYEPDILNCINFLKNAPVNDLSNNRRNINTFLLEWLSGVPYLTVTINGSVLELCEVNNNFLIIFLAGWTEYYLLNQNNYNERNGYLAGIETILDVYTRGNDVRNDPAILNLVSIQKEGKLLNWVIERFR
ncbi:MAG: hypothetical protein FWD47_07625 [Treponema sp.]|nr:hypothetical protein [Treponema sp.]